MTTFNEVLESMQNTLYVHKAKAPEMEKWLDSEGLEHTIKTAHGKHHYKYTFKDKTAYSYAQDYGSTNQPKK